MTNLCSKFEMSRVTHSRNSWKTVATFTTRMWANAERDGRPAEYRWRRLFNAAKFG